MSRRLWLDITDFLRWQGALTGLQHIQYHIAKQYIADGYDIHFFTYDEPTHAFSEVAFHPDEITKDGIIGTKDVMMATNTSVSLQHRVIQALKHRTPMRVKHVAKKMLEYNARATTLASRHKVATPFANGDLVLVLGGIWHGSFAADMAKAKKLQHFLLVHVVHDMIPWRVPAYVVEDLPAVFSSYKDVIFRIADGLVINSKNSKRDAEAFMKDRGITPPPSIIFRLADEAQSAKPVRRPGVPNKGFLLSVGTIEGRKNHMLLYYVYKQALREGITLPPLVIAGRNGWLTDDFRYMVTHDPDVRGLITIHNGVTNSELTWLYQHCRFTIWPSFYEGWGMPVAESLAHGKLCLTSDTSSMSEIAPGLTDSFSPYDSHECLEKIVTYLDPKTLAIRERAIKAGFKTTTWRAMYIQIRSFIDSL